MVRVLPDVAAIGRCFDYLVPDQLEDDVTVGTIVRISLQGRRVRGWVVEDDVEAAPGVSLRPLAKVTGQGPPAGVVDLTGWAAWRWAGPRTTFLRAASPRRRVPPSGGHSRRKPPAMSSRVVTTGSSVASRSSIPYLPLLAHGG